MLYVMGYLWTLHDLIERKIILNKSEINTHPVKKKKKIEKYTCTSLHVFPSLTHFLPRLACTHFPTARQHILARLFTQLSPWYSATSCSVATLVFISAISIYQQTAAVSEPPAAILSSQNKGEHLTVRVDQWCTQRNKHWHRQYFYCTSDSYIVFLMCFSLL